jgi:uncharacterized protein YbjQ (UPF0145 family)
MPRCNDCGEDIEQGFDACWSCGSTVAASAYPSDLTSPIIVAGITIGEAVEELPPERTRKAQSQVAQPWQSLKLTTAPTLEGFRIIETVDVISAECVFGMNMLHDWFASWTDALGGRSEASQNVLRDARQTCLSELRKQAHELGANAVIAIDLDYSEISGQGKAMLFVVASGTAVKVVPDPRVNSDQSLPQL